MARGDLLGSRRCQFSRHFNNRVEVGRTAYNEHHIGRTVKRLMAAEQDLRCNWCNAFHTAGNRDPYRMLCIEALKHADIGLPARHILHHADLLTDDALFLLYIFIRKIRSKYKFKKDLEILLKFAGAGKMVGRHRVTGEGVGRCAGHAKLLKRIAVLILKHLML